MLEHFDQGWTHLFFFLIFKFKFIDFEKTKFKFIDFKKTKFKFIDSEKFKFEFIDFAKVQFKFEFINNSWADSNSSLTRERIQNSNSIQPPLLLQRFKEDFASRRCVLAHHGQGLREGVSGGTSYLGLGGARAQGALKSVGFRIKFWYRTITS